MAAGPLTQITDVVVPARFSGYVQQMTETKSRIIQSGVAARSALIDGLLAGGGLTFNVPSFRDLDRSDVERASTDAEHLEFGGADSPDPFKIQTSQEIAVRLSRNASWSSADLAAALAGADPQMAIAQLVSDWWAYRLQVAFVSTMTGVINDNVASPTGGDTHTQNDLVLDISGAGFQEGITNFSAEAMIDCMVKAGDSADRFTTIVVHSVVYARMQKNNLIEFVPDARGEVNIPTFLGRQVIVDDGVPSPSANIYHSWLFGPGAVQLGLSAPKVPTEVDRLPGAGNGGGQEVLYNRVEWCIHPTGHAFVAGSIANGGPINGDAATANSLAHAASWSRRWPERKQIRFGVLITREA